MSAWAIADLHEREAQAQGAAAGDAPPTQWPAGGLRKIRRCVEHWLDGVLRSAPSLPVPRLPQDVEQGLVEALQAAGQASSLRPGLDDALQHARALRDMRAAVTELGREAVGLLTRLADLESDWAAQQAWLDPLTGLPGRRALQQRLQSEISRLRRQGDRCALALLDLDRFKPVNDRHGHLVGDRYLAAFAAALSSRLRSYDAAFRYGGDEFVLCLPQASEQEARSVVERLRAALAHKPLLSADGRELFASFSAGVAALAADKTLGQVMGEADARLYAAKREAARAASPG